MATKTVQSKVIVCDKTGDEMAEGDANHRTIEWEGKSYTIDLNDEAVTEFDAAIFDFKAASRDMQAWVDIATPVKKVRASAATTQATPAGPTVDLAAVRKWAADQTPPVELKGRGRIPKAIVAAYEAAVA